MAKVTLDIAEFRLTYTAFSDETKYTDQAIETAFSMAEIFFKNETNCILDKDKLEAVLYLMTAHLLQIETNTANGDTSGIVTSASIDKVSVTIADPNSKTEFQYFMNQTPYGQQLLALFKILSMGGFYIGGRPETKAFRKVNGSY